MCCVVYLHASSLFRLVLLFFFDSEIVGQSVDLPAELVLPNSLLVSLIFVMFFNVLTPFFPLVRL